MLKCAKPSISQMSFSGFEHARRRRRLVQKRWCLIQVRLLYILRRRKTALSEKGTDLFTAPQPKPSPCLSSRIQIPNSGISLPVWCSPTKPVERAFTSSLTVNTMSLPSAIAGSHCVSVWLTHLRVTVWRRHPFNFLGSTRRNPQS